MIFDIIIIAGLLICFVYSIKTACRKLCVWRNNKRFVRIQRIIDLAYFDKNGAELSKQNRIQGSPYDFTYGEMHVLNFLHLVNIINPKKGHLFIDLGSGLGKLPIAANMAFKLQAFGVEMLPALHDTARHVQKQLQHAHQIEVEFLCGDLFDTDLTQADIVYINATALNDELWDKLITKFKQLPAGRHFITTSKQLPENHFQCLYQGLEYASWGWVSAFVYVKC